MKGSCRLLCVVIAWFGSPAAFIPAVADEPTYEGFGAVTHGAASSPDGYDTFHVTTLEDDGPGSLRDALSAGKRLIVFDVAGAIPLHSSIYISHSYLTIDGLSAPAPGITILRDPETEIVIEARPRIGPASDIIVRHLRVERQPGPPATLVAGDVFALDGGDAPVSRVILDHLTVTTADDGVFDLHGDVSDVTISWCLVKDTELAMTLTGVASRRNISIHHNVWANNCERLPRMRFRNDVVDFVNNVIFQWDVSCRGQGATMIVRRTGEANTDANIINNYYYSDDGASLAIVYGGGGGPSDDGGPARKVAQGDLWAGGLMGQLYVSGNSLPPQNYDHWSSRGTPLPVPAAAAVTTYAAEALFQQVVPNVGTHHRTAAEQTLLDQIAAKMQAVGVQTPVPDPPVNNSPPRRSGCAPVTGGPILLLTLALLALRFIPRRSADGSS